MLLAGMLTIVSCKKDGSEESFGKPETTTEVQKPEDLGKKFLLEKELVLLAINPM